MFDKEVTLKQIGEFLRQYGWEKFQEVPEPGEKEGVILTGWTMNGDEGHQVAIDPIVEKGLVVLQARRVIMAPPDSTATDTLNSLVFAMAGMNYKMLAGSWGFDPSDGEAVFKVCLFVKGASLEYEDFEQALNFLVAAVQIQGSGLKEILEGTKTARELIAA